MRIIGISAQPLTEEEAGGIELPSLQDILYRPSAYFIHTCKVKHTKEDLQNEAILVGIGYPDRITALIAACVIGEKGDEIAVVKGIPLFAVGNEEGVCLVEEVIHLITVQ